MSFTERPHMSVLVSELEERGESSENLTLHGVRVTDKCFDLATSIMSNRAFRGCRFGVRKEDEVEGERQNSLYLYMPGDIYCRGAIGHRDVGINGTIHKYFVYAPSITNNKVNRWAWQHHAASSENITRAIRLCKEHLRPHTIDQEIVWSIDGLGQHSREIMATERDKHNELGGLLAKELIGGGLIEHEFRRMMDSEYEWGSDQLRGMVSQWLTTLEEVNVQDKRNVIVSYVAVDHYHKQFNVKTTPLPVNLGIISLESVIMKKLFDEETKTYTEDSMPEELMERISSLNLLDEDQFVDNLGWRQSENVYYLVQDWKQEENS
jgi:hypothetical protein